MVPVVVHARGVEAAIAGEVSSGQFGCQRLWVQGPVCGVHRPWAELRLQTWGLGFGGRPGENIVLWRHMDAESSGGPGGAEPRSPGPAVPEGTPVGSAVATGTAASLTGPGAQGRPLYSSSAGLLQHRDTVSFIFPLTWVTDFQFLVPTAKE